MCYDYGLKIIKLELNRDFISFGCNIFFVISDSHVNEHNVMIMIVLIKSLATKVTC
jgi:hypothetical protein